MIAEVLTHLATQLDATLRPTFGTGQQLVHVAPPARRGSQQNQADEGVHLTLINLEREGTASNTALTSQQIAGTLQASLQPLNLNLVILVSSHYPGNYPQSLDVLSAVIRHFQAHPVLTKALPKGLARLAVEWRDMDLTAMHNLWSALGSDYVPSAVYLARMIVVNEPAQQPEQSKITTIALEDD